MSPEPSGDFITLARVVKTQGRRGEVAAEVHSDIPDRFLLGMKLLALGAQDLRRELSIEDRWPHKGLLVLKFAGIDSIGSGERHLAPGSLLVLKFAGIDSISQAEPLIGNELQVPRADRAKLESGWTFVSDLIGCTVFDHRREIGCIEDVQFGAGEAPLLIVRGEDKKFDVPFAESYV